MANIKAHQTISAGFDNQITWRRFIWDISEGDSGATGAYNIATAGDKIVIVAAWARVYTLVSTGSSPTIIWGSTGDTDRFMNTTQGAAASLIAGAVVTPLMLEGTPNAAPTPTYLAAAGVVLMTIATATITTGKIEFTIGFMKA